MKMQGVPLSGRGFGRHMAVSLDERLFPYVVKTAAQQQQEENKNKHPAGVKGQVPPCRSEESSVNRGLCPSAN